MRAVGSQLVEASGLFGWQLASASYTEQPNRIDVKHNMCRANFVV
jgi:hypothetical protein